jgi:hypothetical protein
MYERGLQYSVPVVNMYKTYYVQIRLSQREMWIFFSLQFHYVVFSLRKIVLIKK